MEWANYVAEKNEGIAFPAEIRVVGSYTDRLLKIPRFKDSPFPVPRSAFPFPFPFRDSPSLVIKIAAVFMYKAAIPRYVILRGMVLEKY